MFHARDDAIGRAHEAEAVAPLHATERRHMEHLLRLQFLAKAQRLARQQVAVAFTKGVVHLGQDGVERAVLAVAVPEAHGFEGDARHARVGLQPDLAIGVLQPLLGQHVFHPGQGVGAALPVVGIMERQPPQAVTRHHRPGGLAHRAQRQQHEEGGVVEGVVCRPQARVPHFARGEQRLGGSAHAALREARWAAICSRRASATARPDISPSSWKP